MIFKNNIFLITLGLFFLFLSSCTKKDGEAPVDSVVTSFTCASQPVAKGSRKFGMDIADVAVSGSYSENLSTLKSLGGSFQTVHLNWNQIEGAGSGTTSGTFSDPYGALAAYNALANSDGVKVSLRIHPVDVPGKYVPSDLNSVRFNNAQMLTRAKAMFDYVFTKISATNVNQVFIGNEVDGYNPGSDVNFWLDYPSFLAGLKTYLNATYNVQVGFITTLNGVTDSTKTLAPSSAWNSVSVFTSWLSVVDTIGVTYYPLTSSFNVKSNSSVASDFQKLAAFTSKPIHIEEVGYPSSSANEGTENLQAEFFCEVFKAWDTYASQITSLSILRLNDTTRTQAETVATTYGLTGNEKFIEYIRSLGMRNSNATNKVAFDTVKSELQKRSF